MSQSTHKVSCSKCSLSTTVSCNFVVDSTAAKQDPTCTTNGYATYKCTNCNNTTTQPIQALGHTGATHANGGKCTRCNTVYQDHTTSYASVSASTHQQKCVTCGVIGTASSCSFSLTRTITEPTCKSNGVGEYTCSDCKQTTQQPISATGKHTKNSGTITTPATCTAKGVKTYTCTGCGTGMGTEDIPMIPHTEDSGTVTTGPTCTTAGVKTYKCTVCSTVTKTEEVNALNHDGGTHANGGKCTRCNTVYQTHTETPKVTKEATCKEDGVKTYTCTCGNTRTEAIPKISEHKYDNGTVTKAATCGAAGEKTYTCTVCKEKMVETIPATGVHTYDNGTITKAATCGVAGVKTYTCTVCKTTKTENIPALNHEGATHENGGKCTRTGCGQIYDAHSKTTTVASYNKSKDGHTPVYKCSNTKCTETYTGTLEQHKVTTYTDVKNGTHKGTCTVCQYDVIDPHNYVNNICDKCGAKKEEAPAECEHIYVAKKDDTKHWQECSKCKLVQENSEKNHEYKYTKGADGKHTAACTGCDYSKTENCTYSGNTCTKCGSAKPQEECTHEYEYTKAANGKHTATCTKCKDSKTENCTYSGDKCTKCGATKPQEECTHEYTYTKETNGKHTVTCTKCKDSKTENCTYANNKCTKCGAEKSVEQEKCEHEWKVKIDNNYHWFACSKCSEVKEGSKAKHEIETYKDNKDGTHSGTCTICKQTITVAHTGDDKCDVCGAKIEDNSGNNGGNSNGGKDDTTIKDDKIPQTGIENGGIIAIIGVVLAVGIISIKKFKKYKDIK